jgi:hypothetical protein
VKYVSVPAGDRLHQGEILAGLIQVRQTLESVGTDAAFIKEIAHPFVVVLTQDCDLAQDHTARTTEAQAIENPALLEDPEFRKRHDTAPKYKIDNVELCEAVPTPDLRPIAAQQKELWKRVIQNLDPRFQCLEAVPAACDAEGQGFESIGCDFRRSFTVPTDELYKRIQLQQVVRRAYLTQPYAEHLLQRYCNFKARVALPENHNVPL